MDVDAQAMRRRILELRREVTATVDRLTKFSDQLLAYYELVEDRSPGAAREPVVYAPGAHYAEPPAPGRETMPFAAGGVVRGPGPNHESEPAAAPPVFKPVPPATGVYAPAVDCTCPRYPGGGRQSTDPQCPLHSGDARD